MTHSFSDSIVACSSPPGTGAISIVRVSGKNLTLIVKKLGVKKIDDKTSIVEQLQIKKDLNEKCVLTFFKSPNSFTGEDVLEINCHGNPLIVEMIIEKLIKLGCRRAEPGEFSMRSFLNNKISFLEAEAIDDLINAANQDQLLAASKSLSGKFEEKINETIEDLKKLRIYVESNIDFSDEQILDDFVGFKKDLSTFIDNFKTFVLDTNSSKYLIEGVKVGITGPPNVGKSTLMNILSKEKASIVSEIHGTTRDIILRSCKIRDYEFSLYDTAGIRDQSVDPIEREGIEMAKSLLDTCDVIIEIVDPTNEDFFVNYKNPVIRVRNKSDLCNTSSKNRIDASFNNKKGISEIKDALFKALNLPLRISNISFSARSRHAELMNLCLNELESAAALSHENSLELIAENLRRASDFIGEIKSPYSSDELLGEIFSNFCIGK